MQAGILRAAVAATLLAGFGARAQEVADLPTLQVTAGRTGESQLEVPQAVTVVTREQIERQAPQVMTDLLRGQPGVFTQSSGPVQGIAIVRGLKGSEVLHLVDGMRLNMTFFRNSPSQYIALVDPYNIDRVELLRGPAATLYGSDAMGGVLQVLTPEHRFDGDASGFDGGVRALYGNADLARTGRAWFATGDAGISFAGGYTYASYGSREIAGPGLTGSASDPGSPSTGNGGRQPFTAYDARGGDGKILWAPAPGHELMLAAQFFETPKLPRTFEIVGGPGGPGSGLPVFFEPNSRQFVHARYRIAGGAAFADSLEFHLARQVIDDDRNRLVDAATREDEQNQSGLWGFTAQAVTRASEALRLTYGVDVYRDEVASAKSRTNLATGARSVRDPTFPDGAQEDSLGAYLSSEWQAAARWLLDAGLRYSRVETDLPATAASAAAAIENDDVTGNLGAAFALTPELRWTANLARGFRAPNIFDLGTLGRRPNTDPQQINIPNPGLVPETITSVDTGLKWGRGGSFAELVVFHARYDDRIEPRERTGRTVPNGQFGCSADDCVEVRSENIAQARYWGVEAGARHRFAPALEGYATLNFTRGEEEKKGQTRPANRVPPLNGQLGARYAPGAWSVEPFVRFADRQDRLDDDDRGDVRIDPAGTAGWVTVNLRAGWAPSARWALQLELNNVLDEAYREHGSGIDGPARGVVVSASARL